MGMKLLDMMNYLQRELLTVHGSFYILTGQIAAASRRALRVSTQAHLQRLRHLLCPASQVVISAHRCEDGGSTGYDRYVEGCLITAVGVCNLGG
jgi:hypothetical protein